MKKPMADKKTPDKSRSIDDIIADIEATRTKQSELLTELETYRTKINSFFEDAPPSEKKPRKPKTCSICHKTGHIAKTCPQPKKAAATS